ncbi:WD40 repeat domain-containing protein [uncultured Chloroflexus sp.]|uniref:WD40 repeat domain-containing protein n=1 Tax=uncultured Chloroflexus sp. TaxID=214040 RepID=UPI00260E5E88|nr:WD40 repeat domain-containing protein [uncultured Chloroflexus sp.]
MQRSLRFGLAALGLALLFGLAIVMLFVFWQLLSSVTDEQADTRQTMATVTAVPPAHIWESGGYLSTVSTPGGRLAVASSYQTITLCFPDHQLLTSLPTGGYLAVRPDSSLLAVGQCGAVRDLTSGKVYAYLVCWLPPEEWTEMWLVFSPDGHTSALTRAHPDDDLEVQLWNGANQRQLWSVRSDDPAITVARQRAFRPYGRYIAVTTLPEGGWLIDVEQSAVVRKIQPEPAGSLAFSPDGSRLSVGGCTIRTYDTATWEIVHEQTFPISDAQTVTEPLTLPKPFLIESKLVAISPDGQWLAVPVTYSESGSDFFVDQDPPRQPIALCRLADASGCISQAAAKTGCGT